MPSYKLIYFNARGRAEITRLLFAQAGADYEDYRIQGPTQGPDWPKLKPTMPTGKLPVLEVDGKKLSQSQAIARYVAREFNLAGNNNLEQAQCDEIMETLVDIGNDLTPLYREKDETKKPELKKTLFEGSVKPKLKYLENILKASNGEVFVGKTITIADLALFTRVDYLKVLVCDDPLKDFPKLAALTEKVGKEPKIAAWVAKRPVTAI